MQRESAWLRLSPRLEQFDALFVFLGAERDRDQSLRLAAGKDGGP